MRPRLVVAGATGVLGAEVLASAPLSTGLKAVGIALTGGSTVEQWAARPPPAHTGVVMFESPSLLLTRKIAVDTAARATAGASALAQTMRCANARGDAACDRAPAGGAQARPCRL